MLKGFKDFLLRGNVIDLAVAVVVGTAFTAIVTAFTTNIVNPLVAALGANPQYGFGVQLRSGGDVATFLNLGAVLTAIINFVIVAAIIYFVIVVPFEKIKQFTMTEKEAALTEVELLKQIRNILAGESTDSIPAAEETARAVAQGETTSFDTVSRDDQLEATPPQPSQRPDRASEQQRPEWLGSGPQQPTDRPDAPQRSEWSDGPAAPQRPDAPQRSEWSDGPSVPQRPDWASAPPPQAPNGPGSSPLQPAPWERGAQNSPTPNGPGLYGPGGPRFGDGAPGGQSFGGQFGGGPSGPAGGGPQGPPNFGPFGPPSQPGTPGQPGSSGLPGQHGQPGPSGSPTSQHSSTGQHTPPPSGPPSQPWLRPEGLRPDGPQHSDRGDGPRRPDAPRPDGPRPDGQSGGRHSQ